jgi:hypothetical protein
VKDLTNKEYEKEVKDTQEALNEIMRKRNEILEQFCKAYLAESGLNPSEVELVHTSSNQGNEVVNTFSFREKKDGPQG